MPLVTFTSDFGNGDHYVASVKAALLRKKGELQIIDISHSVEPFDVPHMAFVLNACFKDFPEGTIHLMGLNSSDRNKDTYLAVLLDGHYFLLPDNGIVGILGSGKPTQAVKLHNGPGTLFPTRDILVPALLRLTENNSLDQFGESTTEYKLMVSRQVKATRREIVGHVVRIDHYGNLITNIQKADFDILSKDKGYRILAGREVSNSIQQRYQDVDPGELFFLFNSLKVLEVGINQGNAQQLLGLGFDAPITIQFEE